MSRTPAREAMGLAARRNDLAATSRRNAEVLVAMGMSGRLTRRWSEANQNYLAGNQRASDVAGGLGAIAKVMRMTLQSAVLAVGAYLVIHQEATAGIIIAGSILSARALAPVDLAIAHWKGFVAARQSWHRLNRLLESLPARAAQTLLQNPSSRLSVETVSIVPPGDQKIIVQDVTFALEAGNGLGVIGPSGSGKSSLVRALVGVWQPFRGKVRLDGAALDQWSSDVLGRHIGYLPQDVELFAGSVAQNICRFDPEAGSDAIIAAAKEAGVHQMIIKMRDGYDTQIGEQGTALSAGQAQRVALARALYGDPFLIVLDEPNSNLDTEGDEALTRAIRAARERGAIVVVVAHRPIGIEAVDQLLVLKDGRMQAFGPKETVLGQVLQRVAPPTSDQDRIRRRSCQIMTGREPRGARSSIRLHLIVGLAVVVVLAGGLGGWASTAEISGALIAPGSIVVESSVKKVQHPTGGVVGEVRAHDGDLVKAGDVVVRLDDTVTKASLAIVTKNLDGLWARAARLQAEQQGLDKIVFPAMLLDRADDPDVRNVMASESKLFEVRTTGRIGQKAQLRERVTQLNEEIAGLEAQEKAKDQEIALVEKELVGVRSLYDQHLVQLTRLTTLERDAARLAGERAQYVAARAQAKGKITETELQIIQVDKDHGQRRLQGFARDQRQDRRIRRAQGHGRRPVAADRHPRAAGRHGGAVDGSHRRRGDHRRRRHHDDRAAGRRPSGRGQGQSAGYRQTADRPEDPAAAVGLQPAHHAGIERRRHPRFARRHHRPAHRAVLLHHPRLDAAGRGRAARRGQADPGHAGGSLCADRRPHHAVLSDQAAERPADARVPREVSFAKRAY